MKQVLVNFRYGIEPNTLKINGDCFDTHDGFIYVGCKGEVVAMIRTEIVNYVCTIENTEG